LQRQEGSGEFERIARAMPDPGKDEGLVVREGFAFHLGDPNLEVSDRRAPPRHKRPPATRISSSTGCSLRFELTLLAFIQAHRRAGAKARVPDLGLDIVGSNDRPAWSDVVATGAIDSPGNVYIPAREKRARSVRAALLTLEEAGLVRLPRSEGGQPRFEDFVLLDERGTGAGREPEEYRVPSGRGSSNVTFALPAGFVSQSWIHALEDSEIALILMLACGRCALRVGDMLAISGADRLRHYGIHRDLYSRARKTLQLFGVLDVEEVERHGDGRAVDSNFFLHRLRLIPETFAKPAAPTIAAAIADQLERASALTAAREAAQKVK
jgi:DNA-binding transcriptional ArsR family regulator